MMAHSHGMQQHPCFLARGFGEKIQAFLAECDMLEHSIARSPTFVVHELGPGPVKPDVGGCPARTPSPALLSLECMLPDFSGTAGHRLMIAILLLFHLFPT